MAAARSEGQTKAGGEFQLPLARPPYAKADDVGRQPLARLLVEIGISHFVQELEGKVELVVQWHPAHDPGQCGLVRDHLLHASQAVPGLAWRDHLMDSSSAPVLETRYLAQRVTQPAS